MFAGREEDLGYGSVGVRQARFRPWPRVAAGRASDGPDGGGEQRPGGRVVGCDGEHLRRAERREGHRPPVPAPPPGAERERLGAATADGVVAGAGGRGPQAPQRPSPAVVDAGIVRPASVEGEAVVAPPVGGLSAEDEGEVAVQEVTEHWRRVGLPGDHDETPGDVVEAVPEVPPGHRTLGVLEDADVVAEALHVLEGDLGRAHVNAAEASAVTRSSASAR